MLNSSELYFAFLKINNLNEKENSTQLKINELDVLPSKLKSLKDGGEDCDSRVTFMTENKRFVFFFNIVISDLIITDVIYLQSIIAAPANTRGPTRSRGDVQLCR